MPRRHSRFVRIFGTIVFAIVTVLFAALIVNAFMNGGKPLTTLVPKGKYAQDIQNLIIPVFAIAGVVFVGVMAARSSSSAGSSASRTSDDPDEFPEQVHGTHGPRDRLDHPPGADPRRRRRRHRDHHPRAQQEARGRHPRRGHRPAVVVAVQATTSTTTATSTAPRTSPPPPSWSSPPVARSPCTTASNDVIHSFWIPGLNGKKDAVPGITSPLQHRRPTSPGIYRGQCTEFCGLSHANMRMLVRALPTDEYDALGRQPARGSRRPSPPAPTRRRAARSGSRSAPSAT